MSLLGTKTASESKTITNSKIQKYVNIVFAVAVPLLMYFGIDISEEQQAQTIANITIIITASQSLYNFISAEISAYYRKKATKKIEG